MKNTDMKLIEAEKEAYKYQYIDMRFLKKILYIFAVISLLFLSFYQYDFEFKSVVMLPIAYMVSVVVFIKNDYGCGLGRLILILAYAFRMCLLPVLCAYGNFWIEPSKDLYIQYFFGAIVLMVCENFFVFTCISYFSKKYDYQFTKEQNSINYEEKESILIFVLIIVVISVCILFVTNREFKNYYNLILVSDSSKVESMASSLQTYGAKYYILVLLDILFRPVFSFYFINKFVNRKDKLGVILALMVALLNILIMTDRRIISVLIGFVCFMEVMYYIKKELIKKILYIFMGIGIIGIIFFCFSSDMFIPSLVARKFQRYFSGPTLTAIGINILINDTPSILDFFKLLFNDSIVLTGIFGNFTVKPYVQELCGAAGYSLWTPMIIGLFQYFKIFAPVILALIVKYVIRNDYVSKKSSGIKRIIIDYLSVNIAVYMVMYSIELVIYNIIFIGGFFYLLFYIDKKYSIIIKWGNGDGL